MKLTATRQPVFRGPAAWAEILPNDWHYPELTEKITADVAIVGAGFAGMAAARRLLQLDPSLKIVLLDAGRVAEGGTGRNSGFMIDLPHDLASEDYAGAGDDTQLTRLNRHAINFARQAVEEYGVPRDFFDPVGKVNGVATARGSASSMRSATRSSKRRPKPPATRKRRCWAICSSWRRSSWAISCDKGIQALTTRRSRRTIRSSG